MAEPASDAVNSKSVRSVAAVILSDILQGQSLSRLLPGYAQQVREQDRALLSELAFGVCRWFHQLQAIKSKLLRKPLRKRDAVIDSLILVGLYQLLHTRIKPHAVVAETVNAARHLGKPMFAKLVNGVLRQCQRDQQNLLARIEQTESARYSAPQWLIRELQQAWPQHWSDILQALQQRPPMTLRVNRLHNNTDSYREKLTQANMPASTVTGAPQALMLESAVNVEQLPGFFAGDVSVQDAGAQLAATLLDLEPGMTVLDACAAPGGKTGHILESAQPLAVTAVDVDESRLQRVHENLSRLKLSATVLQGDAAKPRGPWAETLYERILLDVPCSATGVIRRHPDIKLLRREQDIQALVSQQQQILNSIWPLLQPGGQLLYATCSLLPQENQQQISWFLAQQPDAFELPLKQEEFLQSCKHGVQVLPGASGMDGFYYARLGKREMH